jgi:hypothetical protein
MSKRLKKKLFWSAGDSSAATPLALNRKAMRLRAVAEVNGVYDECKWE